MVDYQPHLRILTLFFALLQHSLVVRVICYIIIIVHYCY
jgi:hypothetical protein